MSRDQPRCSRDAAEINRSSSLRRRRRRVVARLQGPRHRTPPLQAEGDVYQPVARRLLERVLAGEEARGLVRVSPAEAAGGLLSRARARLAGARRHAAEHSAVLLFFVGGVCLWEVREARQVAALHPGRLVLVGGTGLVSGADVGRELRGVMARGGVGE